MKCRQCDSSRIRHFSPRQLTSRPTVHTSSLNTEVSVRYICFADALYQHNNVCGVRIGRPEAAVRIDMRMTTVGALTIRRAAKQYITY